MKFVADILPLFEVEDDLVVVVRERRIVTKRLTFRTRKRLADNVANSMKRDGGFHLSEIELSTVGECRKSR